MSLKVVLLTLAVSAVVGPALADWHRSQYPNPQDTTQDFCARRGQKSFVCDPDQKLTFEQANQLDHIITRIMNETRCPCSNYVCQRDRRGYHVGVAVAPGIKSDRAMKEFSEGNDDYEEEKDYGKTLHKTQKFAFTQLKNWKLGKCEDGILIVFDPENYSLFTVGGETALRRLTPEIIGDITMNYKDEFAKGTFEGLHKILAEYRLVLLNKYEGMPVYSHRPRTAAVVGEGGAGHVSVSTTLLGLVSLLLTATLL